MSILKNVFFSEKINKLFNTYPYIILFHHNNMKSKEWLSLKKKLHQVNPSILMKVIPNRFLSQTVSKLQIDNLGSCCLFFCFSLDDLKNILEPENHINSKTKNRKQMNSQAVRLKNSLLNFDSLDEKSNFSQISKVNTLKFLNIGMIYTPENLSNVEKSLMVFFNPYDLKKIIEFAEHSQSKDFSQIQKIFSLQLCNKLTLQNINFLNSFFEFNNIFLKIFNHQHYNMYHILQYQYNLKKNLQ